MSGTTISEDQAQQLLNAARNAARNAYAPYSDFPVGAALLAGDGKIITGVNIENVSYGLTICAERAAIAAAVSQGLRQFQAIAVWAERRPYGAVTPCGACRQFLAEFLSPESPVLMMDAQTGQLQSLALGALLPAAFGELA